MYRVAARLALLGMLGACAGGSPPVAASPVLDLWCFALRWDSALPPIDYAQPPYVLLLDTTHGTGGMSISHADLTVLHNAWVLPEDSTGVTDQFSGAWRWSDSARTILMLGTPGMFSAEASATSLVGVLRPMGPSAAAILARADTATSALGVSGVRVTGTRVACPTGSPA